MTVLLFLLLFIQSCAFRRITRSKNIVYTQPELSARVPLQELNVFAPRRHKGDSLKDVLLFIHGGNWTSGKKEMYHWLGSRLARKDIVTVVIDYPLSPAADYSLMAVASVQAVAWTRTHIGHYGGNPERIFLAGHSAGAHLASLITWDEKYFKQAGMENPVKGLILIDAAGIDMYNYLKEGRVTEQLKYAKTFSMDPVKWKDASSLYHIRSHMPPTLILTGGRTFPSIKQGNKTLIAALLEMNADYKLIVQPRKKHIPMLTQFFNTGNPRYEDLKQFMQRVP